jgi:hypothetical protein
MHASIQRMVGYPIKAPDAEAYVGTAVSGLNNVNLVLVWGRRLFRSGGTKDRSPKRQLAIGTK